MVIDSGPQQQGSTFKDADRRVPRQAGGSFRFTRMGQSKVAIDITIQDVVTGQVGRIMCKSQWASHGMLVVEKVQKMLHKKDLVTGESQARKRQAGNDIY